MTHELDGQVIERAASGDEHAYAQRSFLLARANRGTQFTSHTRGFYAEGLGVVFTTEVAAPVSRIEIEPEAAAADEPDEWDEAADEVRGVARAGTDVWRRGLSTFITSRQEADATVRWSVDEDSIDTVVASVLEMFAKHGLKMTALPEDEGIMVVVHVTPDALSGFSYTYSTGESGAELRADSSAFNVGVFGARQAPPVHIAITLSKRDLERAVDDDDHRLLIDRDGFEPDPGREGRKPTRASPNKTPDRRPTGPGSCFAMIHPRFQEVQRMYENPVSWVALVFALPLWVWCAVRLVTGDPVVPQGMPAAAFWVVFGVIGVLLPFVFIGLRLCTTVDDGDLVVRFWPFTTRRFRLDEVDRARPVTYRPLVECGGWGLRWGRKWGHVLNVSGNRGVHVESGGQRLLIGTRRPDELVAAIEDARRTRPAGQARRDPGRTGRFSH